MLLGWVAFASMFLMANHSPPSSSTTSSTHLIWARRLYLCPRSPATGTRSYSKDSTVRSGTRQESSLATYLRRRTDSTALIIPNPSPFPPITCP
ncbi:hypothetical protein BXZ70DRAFT_919245 [Cristinia sonorae]|uniref:Secreted protein n=1 Tax=Cristinia sonorae TaxID=1940300 RepID=A0A8K0UX61_9AGAR|nr:hypothetical protein BXZ70DRAFT_919245 [Cristinia sonorae]